MLANASKPFFFIIHILSSYYEFKLSFLLCCFPVSKEEQKTTAGKPKLARSFIRHVFKYRVFNQYPH